MKKKISLILCCHLLLFSIHAQYAQLYPTNWFTGMKWNKVQILVRSDHEKLKAHDSAGINLETAKWLVEQKGAILIGSDTSGLEVSPAAPGSTSWNPTHEYLLVQQGVHIAEFHYLEDLARDKVYEFCYVTATNKIRGAVSGFAMRPIAIR